METVKDLVERLNAIDECGNIEAKKASAIDRSLMETVCALSNEPGLGGDYILLGVERDESSLFPYYTVTGIDNPDKVKLDFATQCAAMFNMPVRPEMETEQMNNGNIAVKVFVPELSPHKSLYILKPKDCPVELFAASLPATSAVPKMISTFFITAKTAWTAALLKILH